VLAEFLQVGSQSKKVSALYESLLLKHGSEFHILLDLPIEEMRKTDQKLAEGIKLLRDGKVTVKAGYDGVFGSVKVFN